MTRFESVCTFSSGLAVAAAVNVLTGLTPDNLTGLRVVAAGLLLVGSALLFWSAEAANSAARSRLTQGYPIDDNRYLGGARPRAAVAGGLVVIAVLMMIVDLAR